MTPIFVMPGWLAAFRRYVLAVAIGDAAWEMVQLPLYTVWQNGSPRQIAVAVLHCTSGDVLIAAAALLLALLLVGTSAWPRTGAARTTAVALTAGLAYTIYSEYRNTTVSDAWAYSSLMPRLPWLGTGLAPLAQWLIVPSLALAWATRARRITKAAATADTFSANRRMVLIRSCRHRVGLHE